VLIFPKLTKIQNNFYRGEMFFNMKYKITSIALVLALTSCNNENSLGYMSDKSKLDAVLPGVADRNKVQEILGSPSSKSSFGPETWFYVQQKTNRVAFFAPDIKDQDVVAVRFNNLGIVENVERKGLQDGKTVEISKDETRTEGKSVTLWQQLLGNLGRYNSGPRDAATPKGTR
jgi:outer membrane protein assembly factor BamE (lipoprotein component of BamABCDE complex)